MIKIGIMGLGNIASKAYLPIYQQMNEQVEFHFFTRNQNKLNTYVNKYNLQHTYSDLDEFFELELNGVMIHTPTATHGKYIDKALDNNWHVFVDKPISQNYEEAQTLIQKAYDNKLVLFTGFNRRYAPFNEKLRQIDNKTMIVSQKNRELAKQEAEFAIFDMMIHMIDTSLFILEDPIISSDLKAYKDSNGNLSRAIAYFKTDTTSCITSINMNAGARTETVEVMAEDAYAYSENLNQITWLVDNNKSIETFGDWTPTLHKRGFETMIQEFLNKVINNDYNKQKHALESHYYCMKIVEALEVE